jgi:membrane-associated phospholipid phosphatase
VTIIATVPLALAVSWGRLVDRRHFPIDIASGVALGVGIGAAVHVAAGHVAPQVVTRSSDPLRHQ